MQESVDRSAKLPITSAADADALVADIVRIADSADNLDTVANNIDDVNDVADDITNVNTVADDISSINTVASNISNVNTVAGISSNVTTVAGISANVTTVATNNANVTTAATNIAAINTVASDLNEPTSEIDVVATNITNVNTVGTNIANVNTVAGISSNVTTVAGISANVTTVAGISADVTTVAGISGDVQAVENIAANVTTVAGIDTEVTTVAGIAANVTTVAGISANVSTVAGISADVTAVAADATDIGTVSSDIANVNIVAANIASVNTAASDMADIIVVANDLNEAVSEIEVVANNIASVQTVGDNIADVNTVATDIADVNTVAADSTAINAVADNAANINTVAGIDSDVTTVAGIASDVTIVATNVADITNFSDVYQGPKSTPPTLRNDGGALQLGDLYFNTVSNAMFVYASTGWVPAGSSVNGTSRRFRYIATSGQTTFTGTDSNGNTMAYDAGFVDVYLNGVRLDETDYTASSGDSIVLGSAAALNDELNIVAFGTFSVADINGVDLINNTVTYNKIQALSAGKVLGRDTSGSGNVQELPIAVTSDGSVGFGTNTPNERVTIASPASACYLQFCDSSTGTGSNDGLFLGSFNGVAELKTKESASLSLGTNGIDRLSIDSSGRVTTPYQPAFSAHITGSITNVSTGVVPFAGEHFDIGSNYNTSTYRFTAPVAGVYYFGVDFYASIRSGGLRVIHAFFRKNGSTEFEATMAGGTGGDGGYSSHPTVHSNCAIQLAANDYVDFNIGTASYTGGFDFEPGTRASRFYGYLLG